MKYLSADQIIKINTKSIKDFSPVEPIGLQSFESLQMCVNLPKQSAFGEEAYKSIEGKAAVLFQKLSMKHCFINGNKRTAYMSMVVFLYINGYDWECQTNDAVDFLCKNGYGTL